MYQLFIIIMMCFLLTACTKSNMVKTNVPKTEQVTQNVNSNNTSNEKADNNFQIRGSVITNESLITIQGTSNLFEGTELEIKFDTNQIKSAKVKVDNEGNFAAYIDNPPMKMDTNVWVMMKPDRQPKELQEKYGMDGDKISKDFKYEYKSNGKTITGLVVNSVVDKIAPNIQGGFEKLIPGYE